ncbi:phosphate ABC transporter substrate-binding protein [Duganella sp. FT92W]|uniref:Phosphate ABC transporter substrate-binding protein n=1 Tax=Pseudoduganella rivuli TaxID=2666085 RepID=A0A7X2LQM5_9BURK|nr:phosphate ABC transporter substrate-binding protein [Pseudoduganella rivuli]MRV70276.1 phosphate ABC transporter substrate-binding protein [Pseudoduganella rivuli]
MRLSTLAGLLLAAALGLPGAHARAGELVVIVSAHNPVTALRADQVADIFLGEAMRFPDGAEVQALDQALNTPQRNEFYQKVASRTPALMKAYWTKRIFTGRGQPPRELSSSIAVRKAVADNPGAIGYVERAAVDASVRVVMVVN